MLKERSTLAVVTGNTCTIAATFVRFEKAMAMSELQLKSHSDDQCTSASPFHGFLVTNLSMLSLFNSYK